MKCTLIPSIVTGSQCVENVSSCVQYEPPLRSRCPVQAGASALIFHLVLILAMAGVALFGGPTGIAHAERLPNIASEEASFSIQSIQPDNEYIVFFKEDQVGANSDLTIESYATTLANAYEGQILYIYEEVLSGFAVALTAEAAAEIVALNNVEKVIENIEISIDAVPLVEGKGNQSSAPSNLDRPDQRDLPLDGAYIYQNEGGNVHVYVLDTGIRASHTEFGGRVSQGYSSILDGNGTNDCNGHGTHVAGTIGGTQYGIAKKVKLYPVRVLDCSGRGSLATLFAGIEWVTANHRKPAVVNMSLGGAAHNMIDQAVERSINAGITYVVAAGNKGGSACLSSPARVDTAITVGATTNSDARASFSNYGPCVDIFAPGHNIISAGKSSDHGTRTLSGTSMAAPHVAGAAALYLQINPNHTPAQVFQGLLSNATKNRLSGIGAGSPNLLLYTLFGPTPTPGSPNRSRIQLEAEAHDDQFGVETYDTLIGYVDDGDWIRFDNVYLADRYTKLKVRYAKGNDTSTYIQVRLGSLSNPSIAHISTEYTGGWDSYREATQSIMIDAIGTHDIYFYFHNSGGVGNIDWLAFEKSP